MEESVVFLVIFDTCDVIHKWSISLLPPIVRIVLDNLFGYNKKVCTVIFVLDKPINSVEQERKWWSTTIG